jgi:hypothetical protein
MVYRTGKRMRNTTTISICVSVSVFAGMYVSN